MRFCIFILLVFVGCKNAVQESVPKTSNSVNKLDLRYYNIKNDTARSIRGDTVFELTEEKKYYKLSYIINRSNFKNIYYYNKKTLYSEISMGFLGDIAVGNLRKYDANAKVIFEYNFEKDYPFTALMLVEKFNSKYDIDLLHQLNTYISRDKNYEVDIYYFPDKYSYRHFEIDGKTGNVITDTIAKINSQFNIQIK